MNKQIDEVFDDIYDKAYKHCLEVICSKKRTADVDIYGHDFEDVFHNAITKLYRYIAKQDDKDLVGKINHGYFYSTIINNFREEIGRLGSKSSETVTQDDTDLSEIVKSNDSQINRNQLRMYLSKLDGDKEFIAHALLTETPRTKLMDYFFEESYDYGSIDDLEAKKHRYAVRSYIKNKLSIKEFEEKLPPQDYDTLVKQLKKRTPKWKPLKKAIEVSDVFNLQYYLEWKATEYMDKATRHNGRKFYKKLEEIKEKFVEFGLIEDEECFKKRSGKKSVHSSTDKNDNKQTDSSNLLKTGNFNTIINHKEEGSMSKTYKDLNDSLKDLDESIENTEKAVENLTKEIKKLVRGKG